MEKTSGKACHPLLFFFAGAATLLVGLLTYTVSLLFFAAVAFATALQTLLFLAGRPAAPVLFTALALGLAWPVAASPVLLLLVFSVLPAAYFLARRLAAGEGRVALVAAPCAVYTVLGVAAAFFALLPLMQAEGEQDILVFLDRFAGQQLDAYAAFLAGQYAAMGQWGSAMGAAVAAPTEEVWREALLLLFSVLPAVVFVFSAALGLAVTYLVQLFSACLGDGGLFSKANRLYRPGVWTAVAYLISLPVALWGGDFRNAFCLVCMNVAVFTMFVLAFGALLQIPRVLAFMRRMAVGRIDFTFFAVLLFLFLFFYIVYVLPALGVIYALYIIKSTFFPKNKVGKQ